MGRKWDQEEYFIPWFPRPGTPQAKLVQAKCEAAAQRTLRAAPFSKFLRNSFRMSADWGGISVIWACIISSKQRRLIVTGSRQPLPPPPLRCIREEENRLTLFGWGWLVLWRKRIEREHRWKVFMFFFFPSLLEFISHVDCRKRIALNLFFDGAEKFLCVS